MSDSRDPDYENEIRPLIRSFGRNEFRARDLSSLSSYSPQGLGHKLKSAADKEAYSIEVVDRFPYVFQVPDEELEDISPERNENAEYLEIFHIGEAYRLLLDEGQEEDEESERDGFDEVYSMLEEDDELSEKEVRRELNNHIDLETMGARMQRNGELFQNFKEYRDVEYISEQKKFTLEG
ncbi:hypothetical protein GKQ38_03810 [Candidatus Nanohaloarchaea archaeon]|nr:hypothetical protein GKQ38_03810 [Candidatus Nanohaloarchaea archaeon]